MSIYKLLSILAFISCTTSLQAQTIQFTDLADLPEARGAASSANDGENIYVTNGFGPMQQFTTEIFKYDVATDSWSVLTNLSVARRFASAVVVDGNLYVFNGASINGLLNSKVEVIDLNTGAISFTTNNPQPARAAGVASWNGMIYSFGGTIAGQDVYSDKLYQFNPQTGEWRVVTTMPIAAETKGEIVDGKLYVFGGYNGSVSDRIDVYDIATNSWESTLTMPVGISAHSTAKIGTQIYLTGDFFNLNLLAVFETTTNSFSILSSNLNSRRHCVSDGINGQLYAIGGNTESNIGSAISSVQVAEITTGIRELSEAIRINLFPNPAVEKLSWDVEFDQVIIMDLKGKQLEVQDGAIQQLEVGHYETGLYFLVGKKGDQWYRAKWVKVKS